MMDHYGIEDARREVNKERAEIDKVRSLVTRIAELEQENWDLYVRGKRLAEKIKELESELSALKERHCEDCSYFQVCSNEVVIATGEGCVVDYCSRWMP
jgi:predicted RNase H-like nuclease (RuvC/YqgF family)